MLYVIAFVVLVVAVFIALREVIIPNASPRPDDLGVTDGTLKDCPNSPNCVSTQAPAGDSHAMEPVRFDGDIAAAQEAILSTIRAMPRTHIVTVEDDYIYAEFRSSLMGYIDDVEFYIDAANGVIHFRSASRLGQGDLGANRNRMEEISEKLRARLVTSAPA